MNSHTVFLGVTSFFFCIFFSPPSNVPLNKIFLRPLNKVNGALHNGRMPLYSAIFIFLKFLLEDHFRGTLLGAVVGGISSAVAVVC